MIQMTDDLWLMTNDKWPFDKLRAGDDKNYPLIPHLMRNSEKQDGFPVKPGMTEMGREWVCVNPIYTRQRRRLDSRSSREWQIECTHVDIGSQHAKPSVRPRTLCIPGGAQRENNLIPVNFRSSQKYNIIQKIDDRRKIVLIYCRATDPTCVFYTGRTCIILL